MFLEKDVVDSNPKAAYVPEFAQTLQLSSQLRLKEVSLRAEGKNSESS